MEPIEWPYPYQHPGDVPHLPEPFGNVPLNDGTNRMKYEPTGDIPINIGTNDTSYINNLAIFQ